MPFFKSSAIRVGLPPKLRQDADSLLLKKIGRGERI